MFVLVKQFHVVRLAVFINRTVKNNLLHFVVSAIMSLVLVEHAKTVDTVLATVAPIHCTAHRYR